MAERPDDIDAVLAAARQLAAAIETSERAIALKMARRSVEADEHSRGLFERFDAAGRRIREAVRDGREPAMDDRMELDRLRHEARGDAGLWELLRCQADYVEMLLAIDEAVFRSAPRMGLRLG